jgi:hypothetical protein
VKRSLIKRHTKRNCNEAPGAMEEVRWRPFCYKCGAWTGTGGEIHHVPNIGLGGSTKVWSADPNDPYHLEKICEDCHRARHG